MFCTSVVKTTFKLGFAAALCAYSHFSFSDDASSEHALSQTNFDTKVEQLIDRYQLPGAVIQIKHKGKVVHFKAYGKKNVHNPEPVTTDSVYRIYSMSKPIAAVAVLQLVERGLVKLDEDIRTYLPQFAPFEVDGKEHIVTVHHLLSHTAGFGYGGGLSNWVDIQYLLANPLSRNNSLQELVGDLSGIDLKFAPGEKFEYSIASDIQGALVEAVTKQSLEDYLKTNIFEPLNMMDTGFYVTSQQKERFVDMYEYDAGTFEQAYVFNKDKLLFVESAQESDYLEKPTLISIGGGLVSTTQDYANFVTMLMNKGQFNGRQVVSQEMASVMLSSHTKGLNTHFMPRVYNGVGFGYGVGIKETSGDTRKQGTFFWGGMGGTIFWGDPKSDVQVVAMMQVEDGWVALEKWLIPEVYLMINELEKE